MENQQITENSQQQLGKATGLERRKTVRYQLDTPALILRQGVKLLAARIQDYSLSGIRLVVAAGVNTTVLSLDDVITIEFLADIRSGSRRFSCDGVVVQLTPTGFGVQLSELSDEILNAFAALADQHVQSRSADVAGDLEIGNLDAFMAFVDSIQSLLPRFVGLCLDECYEMMVARMSSPESNAHATRYFEALADLKAKKAVLLNECCEAIYRAMKSTATTPAVNTNEPAHSESSTNDLSLVDNVEFEDWLAVQEMAKRIERKHEVLLEDLGARFAALVAAPNHQDLLLPIAPSVVCGAYHEALCDLEFEGATRLLMYPGIEEGVQQYLGAFYQQINDLLLGKGIEPVVQVFRRQSAGGHGVAGAAEQAGVVPTDEALVEQQLAVPASGIAAGAGQNLMSIGRVLQNQQQLSGGYSTVAGGVEENTLQNVGQVRRLLEQMMPPAAPHLAEDMWALENKILQALLQGQSERNLIPPESAASLTAATQIFQALGREVDERSLSRSYLDQLQLPFMHLALAHPEFIDADDSAAQRVLNLLDQLGNLIGGSKKSWAREARSHIEKIIERILKESADQPAMLDEVEAELGGYVKRALSDRKKTERKLVESSEGKYRVEKAKQLVKTELNERLSGKKVPEIIPQLLQAGWKDILVRTELREGVESPKWDELIGVIDSLLAWFGRERAARKEGLQLIDVVNEQLTGIGCNVSQQQKISESLRSLLIGPEAKNNRKVSRFVRIRQAENGADSSGEMQCRWVDGLRIGQWCFFKKTDDESERLKLVWLSKEPWVAVFANQRGVKRHELTRAELVELYFSGQVERAESLDESLASRAQHAAVGQLYSEVRDQSARDTRTDLPNGLGLLAYLKNTDFQSNSTLIYIELDDYRVVRQACGMQAGDNMMKELGARMLEYIDPDGFVARVEDHALSMVIPGRDVGSSAELAANWSGGLRAKPFSHKDKRYPIRFAMGLLGFSQAVKDVDLLLKNVAVACTGANRAGSNQVKVFSEDDRQLKQQNELLEWAGRINEMIEQDRLLLACQPIVPIVASGQGAHYEILLRLLDDDGKILPPGGFLAACEQLSRMPDVDRWVVSNLMQWMQDNADIVAGMDGFSVNLSGESLASRGFLQFVEQRVAESEVDPTKLTFEITETVAIDNFEYVDEFTRHMRKLGCKFSLDDFGSGYASYSYLRNLDVDYLKIDGTFVSDMHNNPKDVMMVKSMNDIAHSLQLKTIAEFVENQEILDLLGELGVDYAQGYHLGRPEPLSTLEAKAQLLA